MNAQTVSWLVFLALIKTVWQTKAIPFKLQDSHLTAKEGSCTEIKCTVLRNVHHDGPYWFWMKNYNWTDKNGFTATIVYSTNSTLRPVSPDFENRVTYIGSPYSNWNKPSTKPQCSIRICNLNKMDSGNYSFRYLGNSVDKWVTANVSLTVEENPCPITFEKPPVANGSSEITLKCSTTSSCPSYPQIQDSKGLQLPQDEKMKSHTATHTFTVNWQDDGMEFSCQTQDNKDSNLIKNVSVTVEYAPKNTEAKKSPDTIKEGQSVTLACSAKGHPEPSFRWLNQQNHQVNAGAEWTIESINVSQSGEYHCEAYNTYGTLKSKPITINVTYEPQVEVKMTSRVSSSSTRAVVRQGDEITLECIVKRSNPQPHAYAWWKDGTPIGWEKTLVKHIEPENHGTYRCRATNTVGAGTSELHITVEYSPRKTSIIKFDQARAGHPLSFQCNTDAYPLPYTYSWYRYNKNKQIDSSQWKTKTTEQNSLYLESVQRADEACYTCNATNSIDTGMNSEEMCIQVLYPPTKMSLSMDRPTEVTEDQLLTIRCTVESFPLSHLTLTRTSISHPQSPKVVVSQSLWSNTLEHTFNVTSIHTGLYTCDATNSEGSNKSIQRKLVVKYRPKDVTVEVEPGLVVNENASLTLHCHAKSFPPVTSITWMKMTDGKSENIRTEKITVKSVGPSDSGLYSCEASNEIGTGKSQPAEVKVKYAPKHTNITSAAVQQSPGGQSFVELSCSSRSYPPVIQYTWYKKKKGGESDEKVSNMQNHKVYSDKPGVYYCIAKNEISERSSDPLPLFVNHGLMKALKFLIPFLIILLIIVFIVFVYRHKRNKSSQQGTANTLPCFGFLARWNGARRRNLTNEPVMAEPFRSRDDLLQDQPCRPNAQRRQSHPDSTPAANINSVYCTVNLPARKQGPSAQKPVRQQGGHTEDNSLNYASLHFVNKQKNKQAKAEQDAVYSIVSKQKPPKKREHEGLDDYENISVAHAAKPPDILNYDSDTSEEEVELSYTQVNFAVKPGHQSSSGDSSTSDEDETQYSEVKL